MDFSGIWLALKGVVDQFVALVIMWLTNWQNSWL